MWELPTGAIHWGLPPVMETRWQRPRPKGCRIVWVPAVMQGGTALDAENHKPVDVTGQLNATGMDALPTEVYRELRVIAHAQLRSQRADATLNTTALVNEAYVKLGPRQRLWQDRKHFYATMARVMRQVTVDLARKQNARKRDGGTRVDLEHLEQGQMEWREIADLIAIDEAMNQLGRLDPRLEQVLELRFFAGMSPGDVAEVMGLSVATVKRDMRAARAFLSSELEPGDDA